MVKPEQPAPMMQMEGAGASVSGISVSGMGENILDSVCPELVEGLHLSFNPSKEEQGFDKLSPNGMFEQ
jgi:hypothetical protein